MRVCVRAGTEPKVTDARTHVASFSARALSEMIWAGTLKVYTYYSRCGALIDLLFVGLCDWVGGSGD